MCALPYGGIYHTFEMGQTDMLACNTSAKTDRQKSLIFAQEQEHIIDFNYLISCNLR
jgi:hypothetical protein